MKNRFTEKQLHSMPQDILVTLYLQLYSILETMASQNEQITKQNQQLISQVDELKEQVAVLTQQLFGRKTGKVSLVNDGVQIELDLNTLEGLNEAEYPDQEFKEEPEMEKAVPKCRKRKGKRADDLKYVESREIEHRLSEEQLTELFPHGYQQPACDRNHKRSGSQCDIVQYCRNRKIKCSKTLCLSQICLGTDAGTYGCPPEMYLESLLPWSNDLPEELKILINK